MAAAILPTNEPGSCPLLTPAPAVPQGIVSRAVLNTPGLRLTHFHFAVGQELSQHTSATRALVQILTGTCTFTVDGTLHVLHAGDLLHLPPNVPHAVTAPEPFSMLLTQVTPPAT